jgi:hypothetical protein
MMPGKILTEVTQTGAYEGNGMSILGISILSEAIEVSPFSVAGDPFRVFV